MKLPSIGPKTAQRLAFYLLSTSKEDTDLLINAIKEVKDKISYCQKCFFITVEKICPICQDTDRNRQLLCIVADSKDLLAIERSGEYKGLYHVLGGVISPLDGVGPENLTIKDLLARLREEKFKEIIFALNPTVEGEATVLYMSQLIKPSGFKMTRLAFGLPVGSDLDYADEMTLGRSIAGRQEI